MIHAMCLTLTGTLASLGQCCSRLLAEKFLYRKMQLIESEAISNDEQILRLNDAGFVAWEMWDRPTYRYMLRITYY